MFFNKLKDTIESFKITVSGYWNVDETRYILVMLNGRFEILIVKTDKKKKVKILDLYNRELISIIGAGNAISNTILVFYIFK
ncbi:hypothetical protein MYCTH_2063325 [Thermothelomyces thermophilus ATCC 42464]|uniref:Uncharacterized protein n=1 Tax=Thermothelomyces thermophilus (strain ATCC 42464 / BCRC 31852 / DSM 1799) TaxID=573729 RepID=G2QFI3_THET4|nr:uncharacterized protein MYCTH_2063325 [Thermothelomyces thermophilus ATCC 42464]AEO59212.1 hypothetical protein MYCTH_2063325 [Thermothelomyces thermophilus ATCC 42464]